MDNNKDEFDEFLIFKIVPSMSTKKVADFFKNKVTVELKTGHKF